MSITVFYSWQSDLPNPTNRSFIETALERATAAIRADETIEVEPVIDRDTQGVPGSPDIASTILEKIEASEIFVCDVSTVNPNRSSECRPTPNPNVLIELGYALKVLGPARIIMVLNRAYGSPESLPFDLRQKRVIQYTMPVSTTERSGERNKLQRVLENAIRSILQIPRETATPLPLVDLNNRLSYYNLTNPVVAEFGVNSLTAGLLTIGGDRSNGPTLVPAQMVTLFVAVPVTKLGNSSDDVLKIARELFNTNNWYSPQNRGTQELKRYFAAKIFPLNRTSIRTEQDAIVVEETVSPTNGSLLSLRISHEGEVSFATTYYTVQPPDNVTRHIFRLGAIIHLLWAFVCLVWELQERLNYEGNYHICVALKNTEDSFLGHFADGWPDILRRNYMRGPEIFDEICRNPNILVRRENVDLSEMQYKIEPDILKSVAEEIARAFNQTEARCFERTSGKLPENLWPYPNPV